MLVGEWDLTMGAVNLAVSTSSSTFMLYWWSTRAYIAHHHIPQRHPYPWSYQSILHHIYPNKRIMCPPTIPSAIVALCFLEGGPKLSGYGLTDKAVASQWGLIPQIWLCHFILSDYFTRCQFESAPHTLSYNHNCLSISWEYSSLFMLTGQVQSVINHPWQVLCVKGFDTSGRKHEELPDEMSSCTEANVSSDGIVDNVASIAGFTSPLDHRLFNQCIIFHYRRASQILVGCLDTAYWW